MLRCMNLDENGVPCDRKRDICIAIAAIHLPKCHISLWFYAQTAYLLRGLQEQTVISYCYFFVAYNRVFNFLIIL